MKSQEIEQIKTILLNLETSSKKIPYFSDLESHPVFGQLFISLSSSEKKEVQQIIDTYITDKLQSIKKTKGGQLFSRFVEAQPELFWNFRKLNDPKSNDKDFQILGKFVETEMFRLEGILTEKMLKQEKGLDKVVESFYNIVYLFFPRLNEIE